MSPLVKGSTGTSMLGRVRAESRDCGGAFTLAPRIVITANHCVRDVDHESLAFVADGRTIAVEQLTGDKQLDVALMRLAEDAPCTLAVGQARAGLGWRVESQPRENDPMLTGSITATGWKITNRAGGELQAIQLGVDQSVGSHDGYSGSAVTSPPGSSDVVGVLVEQVPSRERVELGLLPRSSNVIYAVPIGEVLERFNLHGAVNRTAATPVPERAAADSVLLARVSGLRVSPAVAHWHGRNEQLTELREVLLGDEHRVISIVGKRGIGKSAIVTKVLAEFECDESASPTAVNLGPFVYLSSRHGGQLTLSAVYQAVSGLWEGETGETLARHWQSRGVDSLGNLWARLSSHRPVIVLDNLDDLQAPMVHTLTDPELEALIESACRTSNVPTIVTTSQHPLRLASDLAAQIHVIEVQEGLTRNDSVTLIRESATRGADRLSGITDERLAEAAARVDGRPRALQKLAAILDRRPNLIDRVLTSDQLPEDLLATLVSTTYTGMSDTDKLTMQTLALAGMPLECADLTRLLDGHLDASSIESSVDRLVEAGEVREHFGTALLQLHPLDADHVRNSVITSDKGRHSMLDRRLAEWWSEKRVPREWWRTLAHATASKREHLHFWRAGDYEKAMAALAYAAPLLSGAGESALVASAAQAARGQLDPANAVAWFHTHMCDFNVEFSVGSVGAALTSLIAARDIAQVAGLSRAVLDEVELWIGVTYRHKNEAAKAVEVLTPIAESDSAMRLTRIQAVFQLGLSFLYLNAHKQVHAISQRLEDLVEADDPPSFHGRCADLRALAAVVRMDYRAAEDAATTGIDLYDATDQERGFVVNLKGVARLAIGNTSGSIDAFREALTIASGFGLSRMEGLFGMNLAWALLRQEDFAAAELAAESAADRLASSGVVIAPAARALADAIRAARKSSESEIRRALARASQLALGNPDIYVPDALFLDKVTVGLSASLG